MTLLYTKLHYTARHYTPYPTAQLQLQLGLRGTNYTTLPLQLDYTTAQLQLQLRYTTLHPAVVVEVTTATIATTPKNTIPNPFRSISGLALPSLIHNSQPLLYVSYFWNFRHGLVRYYRYISISFKIHPAPHNFFYHVFTAISDEHKFSLLQSHLASVMYFVFKIRQLSTASKFMFSSCHLMALLLTLSPMISIADLRRGVEQFSSCVYIMSLDLCVCVPACCQAMQKRIWRSKPASEKSCTKLAIWPSATLILNLLHS